jgi:hypothetical protein
MRLALSMPARRWLQIQTCERKYVQATARCQVRGGCGQETEGGRKAAKFWWLFLSVALAELDIATFAPLTVL